MRPPIAGNGSNDDQISVLRSINQGVADLRRATADGLAALVNPALNSAFIDAISVNNASQATIPIPDGVDLFELFVWVITPLTDGANLHLRAVQGNSVFSGASDYSWANLKGATHTNDAADAQMVLGAGVDSAAGSAFHLKVYRPKALGKRKFAMWNGLLVDSAGGLPNTWSGGGRFEAALLLSGTIDGVQLLLSAGNINLIEYAVKYNSYTST